MHTLPPTILLIHGLWLTPRSWEYFSSCFRAAGYRVVAPSWPRMSCRIEDIRRDPTSLNGLDLAEIVDHFEQMARALKEPPILIGHCFGGLIVQMLLDRGVGAAGVALSSVPPKGVLRWPFTTLRANWSVLRNPWNLRRTVTLTYRQFDDAFCGAMPQTAAQTAYTRYAAPGSGLPIFQAATCNLGFSSTTKVNFRNPRRAPLLLVAASKDRQVPPSVVRANFAKYARSRAKTEYKEFKHRSHLLIAQEGWEDVARFALSWALSKTGNGDLFSHAPTIPIAPRENGLHDEPIAPSHRHCPSRGVRPRAKSRFPHPTHEHAHPTSTAIPAAFEQLS